MDKVPRRLVDMSVAVARFYHRMDVEVPSSLPPGPVLFVANHGFGGVFDLNVVAFASAYQQLGDDRRVAILTHQIAWTLGLGWVAERFDATPARHENAVEALRSGSHVLVFPGGDIDGFKSWRDRNRVKFAGRTGYARLAIEAGVPIVPIVTAGAGESLLVLSSGRRLARMAGLDKRLRLKSFPISVSIPWGLNIGLVGLLPYLPLPTKIVTEVLAPMTAHRGETVEEYAHRVYTTMDDALTSLTDRRFPVVG